MNNETQLENLIRGALSCAEDKIDPGDASLERAKILLEMDKKYGRGTFRNPLLNKVTFVRVILFAFIFVITGGAIGVSAVTFFKADKTDYPFVDDPGVIGKWESVDFVDSTDQFSPDKKHWTGELYLKEQVFLKGGEMLVSINEGNGNLAPSPTTWTKELIINKSSKTASKYKIVDLDGSTYMFFEWKSGDYIFREMQPKLYVLKKVDDFDYSTIDIPRKIDKVDYPFTEDPRVAGTWESVDFVRTIESFKPDVKSWVSDLYLTGMVFEDKGKMTMKIENKDLSEVWTWTNGLILCKSGQTASKYEIKEINGATYLFFEWKSGDYVFRGMQPFFYVLKKTG
jgi:bla regulator protein BlaR1